VKRSNTFNSKTFRQRASLLIILSALSGWACELIAASASRTIESIEVRGSRRLESPSLIKAIDMAIGDALNDDYVQEMRSRVLGLGLYRDVVFIQQKGADPTKAKIIISLTDDDHVKGAEALAGEFKVLVAEPNRLIDANSPMRSYHLGLISRNLFHARHRAAMSGDIDTSGRVGLATIAYGLPRFVTQKIQFDAGLELANPKLKYLDSQGFGLKARSLWTRSLQFTNFQYGVAWYSNTHRTYRVPGSAEVVSGPRFGVLHETRFLGFIPGQGFRVGLHVLPSLLNRKEAVTESEVAATWHPFLDIATTAQAQYLTVGSEGVSSRYQVRLDIPITDEGASGTKADLFARYRIGTDRFVDHSYRGRDAMIGLRYHSSGLIGEIGFQVTDESEHEGRSRLTSPTDDVRP
jgi:hypothetical protein